MVDTNPKILVGLATSEYIRRADFLPYFLALDKPAGTLISTVHGQSPARSRNLIIEQALANDVTHILFIDDDMAIPPDTLIRLFNHDKDVVSALYILRSYPHFPAAFDKFYEDGRCRFMFLDKNVKGLVPIVNCGLGCVLIKIDVFKKLKSPWVTLGSIIKDGWCDDIAFFNKVREAGFEMFCDTDARVGHMHSLVLWPSCHDEVWYTEYKNDNGNILVPQTLPTDPQSETIFTKQDEESYAGI